MLSVANIATPPDAATVVVPARVPAPGFAPNATVRLPVNCVAVLPSASRTVTCTAGVMATPAVVVPGCTVNASCVAAPGVTLNAALVPPDTPVAAATSVYAVPVRLMLRFAKLAAPAAAAPVDVQERVPPPGVAPSVTVIWPLNPVAVFPCASCAVTWTAG